MLTFKLAGRQLWHHALQTKTHSVETRAAQLFLSEVEAQRNERERRSSAESHIIPFRPRSFLLFPPSFAAGPARPSLPRTDSGSRCTPSVTSLCLVCKGPKPPAQGRLCLATPRTPQKLHQSFFFCVFFFFKKYCIAFTSYVVKMDYCITVINII